MIGVMIDFIYSFKHFWSYGLIMTVKCKNAMSQFCHNFLPVPFFLLVMQELVCHLYSNVDRNFVKMSSEYCSVSLFHV